MSLTTANIPWGTKPPLGEKLRSRNYGKMENPSALPFSHLIPAHLCGQICSYYDQYQCDNLYFNQYHITNAFQIRLESLWAAVTYKYCISQKQFTTGACENN